MQLSAFVSPVDLRPWVSGVVAGYVDVGAGMVGSSHFPALVGSNLAVILEGAVELWQPEASRWLRLPSAFLTGPQTKPFVTRHFGPLKFISIFVPPLATGSFVRDDAVCVLDSVTEASDIWGHKWCHIEAKIRDALSNFERARMLFAFFRYHVGLPGVADRLGQAAQLQSNALLPGVVAAQRLGVGLRQYQRRFVDQFGMTPKLFQRIFRLEQMLREALVTSRHDSGVALEHGYYDQAHLARDIRLLVGQPITTLLNEAEKPASAYWPLRIAKLRLSQPSSLDIA